MIRGLIDKELRQHGGLFFFAGLLLGLGMVMLVRTEVLARMGGSVFYLLKLLLLLLFPLLTLVLGNVLIAGEFRQKSQLFLEALPLPRWLMLAVKYGIGLTVAMSLALLLLAFAGWQGGATEAMTQPFALLLAVKTCGWAAFCWAVCFCHGFLGRYRLAVALIIVLGLLGAQSGLGLKVSHFGPFDLIGDQFAFERAVWPTTALAITLGLVVLISALGFALGLVRDATVAGMLSEKMSARERTAFIMIGLTSILIIGSTVERHQNTEPLNLPGSVDLHSGPASVSAAAAVNEPTTEDIAALHAHAKSAINLLTAAREYLGAEDLPPLFLVHRPDFKAGEIEEGKLDSRQGALLRLNALKTPPNDTALRREILHRVLSARQHYRMELTDRRWVLLGFCDWWTQAESDTAPSDRPVSITGDDLRDWLRFEKDQDEIEIRQRAGQCIASMENGRIGGRQSFLQATLGKTTSHDARATFHDLIHPLESELKRATGWDFDDLASDVTDMKPKQDQP